MLEIKKRCYHQLKVMNFFSIFIVACLAIFQNYVYAIEGAPLSDCSSIKVDQKKEKEHDEEIKVLPIDLWGKAFLSIISSCSLNNEKIKDLYYLSAVSKVFDNQLIYEIQKNMPDYFINNQDVNGFTLIMAAAHYGCSNLLNLFLSLNNNGINLRASNHLTALMMASKKGCVKCCRILLKHNVDRTLTIEYGKEYDKTALFLAAKNGYIEVCCELLEHDVDHLEQFSDNRLRAFFFAVENNRIDLCSFFLSHIFKNSKGKFLLPIRADVIRCENYYNRNALMISAQMGYYELCQLFSNYSSINPFPCNVDAVDYLDNTALMLAIEKKDIEICFLLIKKGANINCQNRYGEFPVKLAAKKGNVEICDFLIKKNAFYDQDSLHEAIRSQNLATVYLLLEKIPNINYNDALMVSILSGNDNCFYYCLNKGADINYEGAAINYEDFKYFFDTDPLTPFEAYLYYVDRNICRLDCKDIKNKIRFFFDKGIDINRTSKLQKDNFTPLMFIMAYKLHFLAEFLIENKADVKIKNDSGQNAFSLLTTSIWFDDLLFKWRSDDILNLFQNIIDCYLLLLNKGENINQVFNSYFPNEYFYDTNALIYWAKWANKFNNDNFNNNNFDDNDCFNGDHNAFIFGMSQFIKVIKFLLDHGADYKIKDEVGKTALDYLPELYKQEIISFIKNLPR